MVDYRSPALQAPPRKPVGGNAGLQFHSLDTPGPHYQQQPSNPPQRADQQPPRTSSASHPQTSMQHSKQQQQQQQQQPPMKRIPSHVHAPPQHRQNAPSRNPSTATSSTTSTGGNGVPGRHPSSAHPDVRRSSSCGSTNTHSGYVASMRRQRATVWSDRAQTEDPMLRAQRRAAKQKAMLEVQGGASGRSSTLLSTGKIRHNNAARTMNYNTGTMVGAAVPLRLSANEVGGADDELDHPQVMPSHLGAGTGGGDRGSAGSGRLPSSGGHQQPPQTSMSSSSSNNNAPLAVDTGEKRLDIPEIVETPVDLDAHGDDDNQLQQSPQEVTFNGAGRLRLHNADEQANMAPGQRDVGEEEESFGQITEMAAPSGATAAAAQKKKMSDDLQRRGSVDDRSSSMTGVKLFIANPDLSD